MPLSMTTPTTLEVPTTMCRPLMTTRTGYLINTPFHVPDTTGDRSLTGRRGKDHRLGLCYAILLGELTIYSLVLLQDGGGQKRSPR